MQVKNVALVNLKGEALKNSSNPPGFPPKDEDPVLLVSDVLSNVALATPQGGFSPQKSAERLKFAKSIVDAGIGETFEVPTSLAIELDQDVSRIYGVLVGGQIHEMLK